MVLENILSYQMDVNGLEIYDARFQKICQKLEGGKLSSKSNELEATEIFLLAPSIEHLINEIL